MTLVRRLLFHCALAWFTGGAAADLDSYRSGMESFAADLAGRQVMDPAHLRSLLDQAHYQQPVIDAMTRPYEGLAWRDYRPLFLTSERLDAGAVFWSANAETLAQAESVYGVPPEIIVAIIGIETNYGRFTGSYGVLDALTTLAFAYPPRAAFFRGELEAFLLLCREEGIDAVAARGSYAGAMGKPQFIPSSYRHYAVDFDHDGRRDLWHSDADVIGSVASYLRANGWRPGEGIACRATPAADIPATIQVATKDPLAPDHTTDELARAGIACAAPPTPAAPATLIRLDGQTDEYWIGRDNFFALTRYNRSNLYAMAVYQSSESLRARHAGGH